MVMGTDTGVGKTVVTALLTLAYRNHGLKTVPFKPIEAGAKNTGGPSPVWPDSQFLAAAAGLDVAEVGLYRFQKAVSPHLAAAAENTNVDLETIYDKYIDLASRYDAVLIEGAGGVLAPLTKNLFLLDLAERLGLPVVVVARPGIGTLNHTLLSVNACRDRGLTVAGIIVNRFPPEPDEAELSNPRELTELSGAPIIGVIPEIDLSAEDGQPDPLAAHIPCLALEKLAVAAQDYHDAIAADRRYVWHPFSPMLEYLSEDPDPLMIVAARGAKLIDANRREYIDGVSSLWVNVHGHRRRELDDALKNQLSKVAHTTLLGLSNEPAAMLAKALVALAPPGLTKVFYSDNGSTAIEVALKVAFQYQKQRGRPEKTDFVTFANAYHGDTLGAVSVGGHELFHSTFSRLLFKAHLTQSAYCYRCPVGLTHPECELACLSELQDLLKLRADEIAAVIFEPKVQGAAGILVQPPGYMRKVADLCRQYDVLLVVDEVATGFGRTGALFACNLEGVEPDIMALAKGITGGYLPLAATLFREEIYQAFLGRYEEHKTFFHGHTYTGNPLACSVALANLALISKPDFLPTVKASAQALETFLRPLNLLDCVGEVRQCGLMAGIELVADKNRRQPFPVEARTGRRAILKARERGVIVRPLGDVVVLMPPPVIKKDELRELVDVTAWAIEAVTHG